MRARAEMRKELSAAIRKSEPWFAGSRESLSFLSGQSAEIGASPIYSQA